MVDFGAKLKELRQQREWTQKEVANKLGVTSSIVSAYENNTRQPSYEILIKLTGLFDVSADYLLGISGSRNVKQQHLVSLDSLPPHKIILVEQLISVLKE